MKRRYMKNMLLILISIVGFCFKSSAQKKEKLPNIVFILADDLGYGDVKCFNPEGKIATPNIDKLASEGMKFTDAHASSSVCTPSRYSILTGRYPWRSRLQQGVLGGFSKPLIDSGRTTVASFLKQYGYHTSLIGKWHLGLDWPLKNGEINIKTGREVDYLKPIGNGPITHGFDYFFGISASLDMEPFVFIENDRTLGIPSVEKTFMRKGLAAPDFEAVNVVPTFASKSKEVLIKESSSSNPFFLYVTLPSPHTPISPNGQFSGKSEVTAYGDYVMETDWVVGEITKTLDSLGLTDNTIVLFSSDNGFAPYVLNEYDVEKLGHFPSYLFRGYKSDIWDGGHRVPLIAKWPKHIKAGASCAELVSLTDFMATCSDIIKKPLADSIAEDSFSILPYLKGTAKKPVRSAIVYQSIDGNFSIQQDKWKLELCPGSGGWSKPQNKLAFKQNLPLVQLYNMQNDPSENNNIQAQYPEIVKSLTQLLQQYIKNGRSTAGQPLPNTVDINIWKKNNYTN